MKIFTATTIALATAFALPLMAETAPVRKTEAELRVNPAVVKFCQDKNASVATAKYIEATGNKVTVTCTGGSVLPLAGLGGLSASTAGIIVGTLVLATVINGGGDAPSDTQ